MVNVGLGNEAVPDHGYALFITSVVMIILSGFFVCARIGVRLARKSMGTDDYITLIALANLIALTTTECLVVNGYGKHMVDLTPKQKIWAFKYFYGAQITYKTAVGLYKLAFLFCYLRIFIDKRFRWACYFMIGLVTASTTAFTLVTIWQCHPLQAFWNRKIPGGRCFDSEAFWFSYSLINILLDVAILVLPVRQVLKLHVNKKEKFSLVAVFLLGIFVCITSIVRTTTLSTAATSKDTSWYYIPPTLWSVIEANTGIICASLPMLKQPLAALFPRIFSGSTLGRSSDSCPLNTRSPSHALKSRAKPRTGNCCTIESVNNDGNHVMTDDDRWLPEDRTIVGSSTGTNETQRNSDEGSGTEMGKTVIEGNEIMITKHVDVDVETHTPRVWVDDEQELPPSKEFSNIGNPSMNLRS